MENDKLVRLSDVIAFVSDERNRFDLEYKPYLEAFKQRLDSIPAVDAVEVRHAYWKNDHESQTTPLKDGYNCSACGEPATTAYNGAVRSRWCPWCGARMDGEEEHNAVDRR